MAIIESIVSQHAEEAAFLWLLRDAAVVAPHYSLEDLAELDDRVEAHIDGLRVAGEDGWPFCAEGLEHQESGEVFAAAVVALEGENRSRVEQVYAAVEAAPETARGLVSAIGWLTPDRLQGKVAGLLSSASPLWRRVGITACSVHRVDCGQHLTKAIEDADFPLRARALRATGETGRRDLLPLVRRQIQSKDTECAFWAAWSAVLLGDRGDGVSALKAIALSESPFAGASLRTLVRLLSPSEAQGWLRGLSQNPDRQRDLVVACGAVGDPVYAPWLIKQMQTSHKLARVAGEAFSFITGIDISEEDLEGESPEGFESGPTEHPEDEDVSMDPDEDLPWPDPERIQAWWKANEGGFPAGTRYLVGEPVSETHCRKVLRLGFQRQRNAAALELALLRPDDPLFETRAPGFRQKALLAEN
ncbi:MAG: TIGR02270 family protein [Pseudomonadota bacterium]|nr:TIGR02270 family protein [Pseudomonadota bacterium]